MVAGDTTVEEFVLFFEGGGWVFGFPSGQYKDDGQHWWFRLGFRFGAKFKLGLGLGLGFSFPYWVQVWVWCVQRPVGYSTYCNEITVRLRVPGTSKGGQWILTMVVWNAFVLIAIRSVSPRG